MPRHMACAGTVEPGVLEAYVPAAGSLCAGSWKPMCRQLEVAQPQPAAVHSCSGGQGGGAVAE